MIGLFIGDGRADIYACFVSAGGAYLIRQNVINTGLTWQLANPNRFWAHANVKN
jgi:hypothetical protein